MCKDARRSTVWDQLRQRDLKLFGRWLQPDLFARAATKAAVKLGSGPLNLLNLVWLAIGSALHTKKNFASVLTLVLKLLQDAGDWSNCELAKIQREGRRQAKRSKRNKHDPRGQDPTQVSEEAFVQARQKMPWGFWVALVLVLTEQFEQEHGERNRWKGFRLLAMDGTTVNLPHWRRLREYFGTVSNGRGRRKTQARMVLLQMPLTRMPWHYEVTPLREGERTVASRLLAGLHGGDMLLMDRGFWSFGLFWQIQNAKAFFAIRLVAYVNLRTERRLGMRDCLAKYQPVDWRKQWRKQGLPKAMTLRVIRYQIRGFRPSAVVTNMLDPKRISREEWIRLATIDEAGRVVERGLYHRRWEIETTFRELKQTQGMEGNLRSRTPEGIRYEIAGHMLLYALVRWLIVEAAAKEGLDDPLRLSFKDALDELNDMRHTLLHADPAHVQRVLLPRLLTRIATHLVPERPGRHYPRPRDGKPKYKGNGRYQQQSKLQPKRT